MARGRSQFTVIAPLVVVTVVTVSPSCTEGDSGASETEVNGLGFSLKPAGLEPARPCGQGILSPYRHLRPAHQLPFSLHSAAQSRTVTRTL
jgi:hypothetical protein